MIAVYGAFVPHMRQATKPGATTMTPANQDAARKRRLAKIKAANWDNLIAFMRDDCAHVRTVAAMNGNGDLLRMRKQDGTTIVEFFN